MSFGTNHTKASDLKFKSRVLLCYYISYLGLVIYQLYTNKYATLPDKRNGYTYRTHSVHWLNQYPSNRQSAFISQSLRRLVS